MQASAAYSWTLGLNERVWGETNRGGGKGGGGKGSLWGWQSTRQSCDAFPADNIGYIANTLNRDRISSFHVFLACVLCDLIAIGYRSSAATCIIDWTRFAHVAAVTRGTATTTARTALSSSC